MMGVAKAADELGVSDRRVRQMLLDGLIPGERVGRSWVLDEQVVREHAKNKARVGRPWSPSSAWAVLAVADGKEASGSAVEQHRARKRLEMGIESIRGQLANRAERRLFYAHPSLLEAVLSFPGFVASGVSALVPNSIDLVVADQIEGYVAESELAALVDAFALDGESERPNIHLRVVNDDCWPFAAGQRSAPMPVVAADLLESDDERTRRAGLELLDQI